MTRNWFFWGCFFFCCTNWKPIIFSSIIPRNTSLNLPCPLMIIFIVMIITTYRLCLNNNWCRDFCLGFLFFFTRIFSVLMVCYMIFIPRPWALCCSISSLFRIIRNIHHEIFFPHLGGSLMCLVDFVYFFMRCGGSLIFLNRLWELFCVVMVCFWPRT